jgi:hypothetical protein
LFRIFLIASLLAASIGLPVSAGEPVFSGAVKDSAGKFLAGVEILLIAPSTSSDPLQPVATVRSDAKGRFLVESLETGAYQIAAVKRGYRTYIGQVNTRIDQWISLVMHPHARLEQSGLPSPEDDAWALRLPRRNILRETEATLPEFELAAVPRSTLLDLPVNLKVDQLFKIATDLQRAPQDDSVVQGVETRLNVAVPLGTRGSASAQGSRERLKNSRSFDGSAPTARDRDRLSARFSYDTSIDTRIQVEAEYAGGSVRWAAEDALAPALDHDLESWRGAFGFEQQLGARTHLLLSLDYAHAALTVPVAQALQVSGLAPSSTNRGFAGSGSLARVGEHGRRFELDFDIGHLDLSAARLYATSDNEMLRFGGLPGWSGGFRARETWDLAQRFSLTYGVGYRHVVGDVDASLWTPHLGGQLKFEPLHMEWVVTYYGSEDWNASLGSGDDRRAHRRLGYEASIQIPLATNLALSGSVESRPMTTDRRRGGESDSIGAPSYVTDGNAALARNRVTLTRETPTLMLFAEVSRTAVVGSVAAMLAYDLPFQEISDRDLDYNGGRLGLRFVPQGTLVTLDLREVRESRKAMPDVDSAQRQVELTLVQDLLQRGDLGHWRFLMSLSMADWTSGDPGDLRQIASADRLDATDSRLSAGLSLEF